VIIGGMTYATLMTLYVVPLMYDLLSRRPPLQIDVGGDELDDVPDDAAEYLSRQNMARA
jgi:HAE1 family hydrophobic/amphiphilic exporter-1